MAEEVKKIITVEVGKSITSVRDFKKHIDDLRGSLLGLNEESEEYKTIAEQIATDQAKLNDIMKIGKTNTDAAAGSYVELNNQLKALRNQYKALSESERNSTTGQAILQNITKLDTQLKDIDESMGQYQRNVGNYKQAFEGAFQTITGEISKINPTLGAVLSAVQKLIPAFKGVGTAAKATGTSIKTAMASTGIGLLVVALSEIIAHWKEISEWVNRVFGRQKEITTEIKSSADQAKELRDRYKEALEYQNRLRKAQGKTDLEILNEDIDKATKEINAREAQNKTINEYLEQIKDFDNKIKKFNGYVNTVEGEFLDQMNSFAGKIKEDMEGIGEKWGTIISLSNNFIEESVVTAYDAKVYISAIERVLRDQVKENNNIIEEELGRRNQLYKDRNIAANTFVTETEKRAKAAANALKSEIEQRKAKYEEDKKYAEENIKDLKLRNQSLKNLEAEFQADLQKIYQKAGQEAAERLKREQDAAIEIRNNAAEYIRDYGKSELELLDDKYKLELGKLEKFNLDTTALTAKWLIERRELIRRDTEEGLRELQEAEEKALEILRNAQERNLQQRLDNNNRRLDWALTAAQNQNTSGKDYKWDIFNLFPGQERPDIQKEREQVDLIYQIEQQGYSDRLTLYENYLGNLEEGSQEYLETERAIHEEKIGLANLEYEHDQELNKRVIQDAQERRHIITTLASDTASVWSSITDAILADEEQGSNKWKAFKTSEAVVNMLSGVLAAFMSGFNSGLTPPWNIALATSTAAVAAAAGAAQIAQIQSTKMGSTSSASNAITGGASGVGVSPLLNPDYDLQRLTNLSLQSDAFLPGNTQVYVLESDIQEVGNRVQVRENNATF